MDAKSCYEIAKNLESKGYWKQVLPTNCHVRLVTHLESEESWIKFFTISASQSETSTDNSNSNENSNENSEQIMRAQRRKNLGEDGLLSLRIRVLLIDIIFYNTPILSNQNVTFISLFQFSYDLIFIIQFFIYRKLLDLITIFLMICIIHLNVIIKIGKQ